MHCCFCAPIARHPDSAAMEMSPKGTFSKGRVVLGAMALTCPRGFVPAPPRPRAFAVAAARGQALLAAAPSGAIAGIPAGGAGIPAARAPFMGEVSGADDIAESEGAGRMGAGIAKVLGARVAAEEAGKGKFVIPPPQPPTASSRSPDPLHRSPASSSVS